MFYPASERGAAQGCQLSGGWQPQQDCSTRSCRPVGEVWGSAGAISVPWYLAPVPSAGRHQAGGGSTRGTVGQTLEIPAWEFRCGASGRFAAWQEPARLGGEHSEDQCSRVPGAALGACVTPGTQRVTAQSASAAS